MNLYKNKEICILFKLQVQAAYFCINYNIISITYCTDSAHNVKPR